MKFQKNRLKIALPKKGRLRQPVIELFQKAGYQFKTDSFLLQSICYDESIEFVFLRSIDIPKLVEQGIVDLGVTGSDQVLEKQVKLEKILSLEYGQCRICLAGEGKRKYQHLSELSGLRVATSYPNITKEFFRKNQTKVECIELEGSIEVMIKLKIADMIIDVVDTGETLKKNHLNIWETIDDFSTYLYSKQKLKNDPRIIQIKKRLHGVIIANMFSVLEYNIPTQLLKKAEKITPGFDGPTISSLDTVDMFAVKVMIKKQEVSKIIDRLEALGASAIYETEIKKFRP